jgi:signal transduction histidine kinase
VSSQVGWLAGSGLLSEDELQELLRLALGPVLAGKQEVYHLKNLIVGPRELLIRTGTIESSGVLVAVQDSGPGLEAAMLERVFESFYTTKPTGLGLGLSICRSIIEAHGGRLWASTNQRRGATFQFTLPRDEKIPS